MNRPADGLAKLLAKRKRAELTSPQLSSNNSEGSDDRDTKKEHDEESSSDGDFMAKARQNYLKESLKRARLEQSKPK